MRDIPPIVIGGTGGSGTRAVAEFCKLNGVFMGTSINDATDALEFVPALSRIIDPILLETRSLEYGFSDLSEGTRKRAVAQLDHAATAHLSACEQPCRWGFKNPRQLFILPVLDTLFPELFFVHVVRDGRDMILSQNQNQPRQHYATLFNEQWPETLQANARFWATTNLQVSRLGPRLFGKRYIRVRIEDLCDTQKTSSVQKLAESLGFTARQAANAVSLFEARPSFGRGRTENRMDYLIEENVEYKTALQTFGYL